MTPRGRWLGFLGLGGFFLGTLREQSDLSLLSLSVLLWLLLRFSIHWWRLNVVLPQIRMTRRVNGRENPAGILYVGRTAIVQLRVFRTRGRLPSGIVLHDVLPENLEHVAIPLQNPLRESHSVTGWPENDSIAADDQNLQEASGLTVDTGHRWSPAEPLSEITLTYAVKARGAGEVTQPGLQVVVEDIAGLFRAVRFLPAPQEFRILPDYAKAVDSQPLLKRVNALPQHGVHRLKRSGMGCELLDLREYVMGDPPKSIAWKASARRDHLMTRQYESEVPVRVQLFMDGSYSTRIGGFGLRMIDQMNYVASSIARTAVSAGDPLGAFLFDERRIIRVASMTGERGFYQLLNALSDFSVSRVPPPERLTQRMIDTALAICGERYPELLEDYANPVPFTIFPLIPGRRRAFHNRCQLAAILAHLSGYDTAKQVRLIEDDALMAVSLQRFLTRSGAAWMDPVVAPKNAAQQYDVPRLEVLSQALSRAVAHAHDHEVFVVLADLVEMTPAISYLLPAVRAVLARHHRIAFVCPSPIFQRSGRGGLSPRSDQTKESAEKTDAESLMLQAERVRLNELSERLKKELSRLGAVVTFSGENEAIRMIQSEIQLARTGRSSSVRALQ
ncbi:MAG: DUF58 domain-containing protein [Planctomyces sp.]